MVKTEKRLIDANALEEYAKNMEELALNRVCDTPSNSPCYSRYSTQYSERREFRKLIQNAPTVDAMEVVRCKDCKWFANNNGGEWYGCKMFNAIRAVPEDAPEKHDFCSCGERKDND